MDEDDEYNQDISHQHPPYHVSLPSNSYASAYIGGNSRPVLGNIIYHHNHYHGGRQSAGSSYTSSGDANFHVARYRKEIDPDAISDYDPQYACWLRSQQRLADTCQWFLDTKETKRWRNNIGQPILICTGSVGSGKSVTAAAMVDCLTSEGLEENHLVASYFVDVLDNEPVTAVKIVRALVKQVFLHLKRSSIVLPPDAKAKMESLFIGRLCLPNLPLLTQALWELLKNMKHVVFIVDGLDCLSENESLAFLQFLSSIFPVNRETYTHKVMLFSRDILGRQVCFDRLENSTVLQIGIHHVKKDIETYIEHEVSRRQVEIAITQDSKVVDEIKSTLKAQSAKM